MTSFEKESCLSGSSHNISMKMKDGRFSLDQRALTNHLQ